MSWSDLPLLPLCRVYEYLNVTDVISAASTCTNWRCALMFHNIPRDQLSLQVDTLETEKNIFLANLFRHSIKDLRVVLTSYFDEYTRFAKNVLECFCDSKHLTSLTLVPTSDYYLFERTHNFCYKQTLASYLIEFCEVQSLTHLNIHGCGELVQCSSTILQRIHNRDGFKSLGLAGVHTAPYISSVQLFHGFNNLEVLSLNYDFMLEELIFSMEHSGLLPSLQRMVINLSSRPEQGFRDLSNAWTQCRQKRPKFEVYLNCICLPPGLLEEINYMVLKHPLPLATFRVLFCRTISMEMLRKMVYYEETLREVHWADSVGHQSVRNKTILRGRQRMLQRNNRQQQTPNPLVMMCWRCPYLQNITLHGYWHTAHDLLGMARLRGDSLQALSVSALVPSRAGDIFKNYKDVNPFTPVHIADRREDIENGPYLTHGFIQKMKCSLGFPWKAPVWSDLHPALLSDPDKDTYSVYDYILKITCNDLNITADN